MRKPRLFEVFAGTGVVLVLAAILWPVTSCACGGESSKRVACVSNLKQQGLAVLMYAGDWDNVLPDRDRWMDAAKDYTHNQSIFKDSEVKGEGLYGYSFNADLSEANTETSKNPEKVSMAYDSINLGRNASDRVNSLPVEGRHKGRNGMSYLDGHAKSVPAAQASP